MHTHMLKKMNGNTFSYRSEIVMNQLLLATLREWDVRQSLLRVRQTLML